MKGKVTMASSKIIQITTQCKELILCWAGTTSTMALHLRTLQTRTGFQVRDLLLAPGIDRCALSNRLVHNAIVSSDAID